MKVRKKTKKRVLIILAVVVLLGLSGGGLYLLRQRQLDDRALKNLKAAQEADKGDFVGKAITHYKRYLQRFTRDPAALHSLAGLLNRYPESGPREIKFAISSLNQALSIDPYLPDARRLLMNLYLKAGYDRDALELAKDFLGDVDAPENYEKDDSGDREALWVKAVTNARLGETLVAHGVAEKRTETKSAEMKWFFLLLDLKQTLEEPAEDILAWAERMAKGRLEKPAFRLLLAEANLRTGNVEPAAELLAPISGELLETKDLNNRLIRYLDRLGQRDQSIELLRKAYAEYGDVEFLYEVVERLWQRGGEKELEAVADLTDDFEGGDRPIAVALLGYRALTLNILGRQDDAADILKHMREQKGLQLASAWTRFLEASDPKLEGLASRKVIDAALAASTLSPYSSVFYFYLGNAYDSVGEADLAVKAWWDATVKSRTWSGPAVRAARQIVLRGFPRPAGDLLRIARNRWPEDPNIEPVQKMIDGGLLPAMDEAARAKFLEGLKGDSDELDPGSVPMRCLGLVLDDRLKEARALIGRLLESGQEISPRVYLGLYWIAASIDPAVSDRVGSQFERDHGQTVEFTSFKAARSMRAGNDLVIAGKQEEGLALIGDGLEAIRERRAAAPDEEARAWAMTEAEFLELATLDLERLGLSDDVRRPWREKAQDAWVKLGDAYPQNIAVQRAVAKSRLVWGDREFANRTVERLRAFTGESGIQWRIARVRSLLQTGASQDDVAESVGLLSEILRVAPHRTELRLMQALALERLGSLEKAVENLKALLDGGQATPAVHLLLARFHAGLKDFRSARDSLTAVVESEYSSAAQLLEAAALASRLGAVSTATAAMDKVPVPESLGNQDRSALKLRARMSLQLNRVEESERLLKALLVEPDLEAVRMAITFYAEHDRREEAEKWISYLDKLDVKPSERSFIEAEYLRVTRQWEASEDAYRSANAGDEPVAGAAVRLLSLLLARGKTDEFLDTIDQIAEKESTREYVSHLTGSKDLVAFAASEPALRGLLAAWVENPAIAREAGDLVFACRGYRKGDLRIATYVGQLSAAADASEKVWAVQQFTASQLAQLSEHTQAIRIAERGTINFPAFDGSRLLLADVLVSSGRIVEASAILEDWKETTIRGGRDADLLLGRISFIRGDPGTALATLEPRVREELGKGRLDGPVVGLYLRALVQLNRTKEAREILDPLCRKSSAWRLTAMQMAATDLKDVLDAEPWLLAMEKLIPEDANHEFLALARGWVYVYNRTKNSGDRAHQTLAAKALSRSEVLFKQATDAEDVTGGIWMLVGMYQESAGMLKQAELSYRRAMDLQPELLVARNNLAMILTNRGKFDEALRLAKQVVKDAPTNAEFRDTLAVVYRALGKHQDAVAQLQRAWEIEPLSPRWPIYLSKILITMDQREEARRTIRGVKLQVDSGRVLLGEVQKAYNEVVQELDLE